ncbi:hypothetical protein CVT25_008085 [Psilocybe cyanescens]|uniref:F-box domain-containing protein n=1 Tax=Psilocybe cyanescens TaxID=93625 RepID=A0A409WUM7_PSICY|nr:hypothetical protein CVT25_008085 [Psilocybe cyanescens]
MESEQLASTATPISARDAQEILRLRKTNDLSDPMAKLPLDNVLEIFDRCLESPTRTPEREEQRSYIETVFTLGSVCRSWRQTVWSTPGFWKYMPLIIGARNMADTLSIIQGWIERASNLPISVKILVDHKSYPFSKPNMRKFIQVANLINVFSSQLETFSLKMPVPLMSKFSSRSSYLKEICLYNNDDDSLRTYGDLEAYKPWTDRSDTLGLAKLEETKQKSVPNTLVIGRILFKSIYASWNNLITVHAQDINVNDFFRILQGAPRLQEFQIFESRAGPYYLTEPVAPIAHTALVQLDIDGRDASFLDIICRNILKLSALQRLFINLDHKLTGLECLVELIGRSSPPLGSLVLHAPLPESLDLVSMLKAVPQLTYLAISPSENSDRKFTAESLFNHFSHTKDEFLPVLQSFSYDPLGPKEYQRVCNLIPNIFDIAKCPRKEAGSNIDDPSRRPLNFLGIYYQPPRHSYEYQPPKISSRTRARIDKVMETGVEIDIEDYRPIIVRDIPARDVDVHEEW